MNPARDELRLSSPAKLNLFLHIVGRRGDGYHLLQTAFQLLDYGDSLTFTSNGLDHCRLARPIPGVPDETNLVLRAARLLEGYARRKGHAVSGFDIDLDKRLPMGGGLGGGSSNAATVLLGLNFLWRLPLNSEELAQLGLGLGADVPVFVHGRTAWAEGIGERLTPIPMHSKESSTEDWFLILQPPVIVSTASIFSDEQLTRNTPVRRIAPAVETLSPAYRNDCQAVVVDRYPVIGDALDWLGQYATSRLTGTGCCVFAHFSDEARARAVLAQRPEGLSGFVARGVAESPLLQELRK